MPFPSGNMKTPALNHVFLVAGDVVTPKPDAKLPPEPSVVERDERAVSAALADKKGRGWEVQPADRLNNKSPELHHVAGQMTSYT